MQPHLRLGSVPDIVGLLYLQAFLPDGALHGLVDVHPEAEDQILAQLTRVRRDAGLGGTQASRLPLAMICAGPSTPAWRAE